MKGYLERLLEQHKLTDEDFMGFKLSKKNPYTFHHIDEKRNGGKKKTENGAALTKRAHELLNEIERVNPELYEEWNLLFAEINKTKKPFTEEHKRKIKVLRMCGENIEKAFFSRKKKGKKNE